MDLMQLYGYAEQKGVTIVHWKIDNRKACAIKMNREYHILMNDRLIDGERDERVVLAHELGHCRSDRMYYLQDYCNPLYKANITKAERKARDEACRLLVNPDELKKALRESDTEYAAAESLDLDVTSFREIVTYYKRKGLIEEKCDANDYT